MYTIAYFSPTGNTKYLANQLAEKLEPLNASLIDIASKNSLDINSQEHLILMFSIHAFNAPKEVIKYINDMPSSKFKKVSFIAVGCNTMWMNDAATSSLKKICGNKGWEIHLDRVVAMPLTLVVKLSQDENEKVVVEALKQIELIASDLSSNTIDNKEVSLYAKSLAGVGKVEKHAAKLFGLELHANKDCISCGICWNNCPSNNIKKGKNNKPKFSLNCSMCMRCIYQCPAKAISPRVSKFLPIKGGYSIQEYIKAIENK